MFLTGRAPFGPVVVVVVVVVDDLLMLFTRTKISVYIQVTFFALRRE